MLREGPRAELRQSGRLKKGTEMTVPLQQEPEGRGQPTGESAGMRMGRQQLEEVKVVKAVTTRSRLAHRRCLHWASRQWTAVAAVTGQVGWKGPPRLP